ncbi:MAG TPA: sigma-70 family RNA polymerase sigma factor [Pyrinomonadaceae bacterium]|jgi:RNA polymerase sigma factor (sigma-70 family)
MKGDGESGDGTHGCWDAVIEKDYGRWLKLACRLTRGNVERAEDIVHDAICKVLTGEYPLRVEQAASAYMRQAVRSAFYDEKKQFSIQIQNKDDAGGGDEPSEVEAGEPDKKEDGKKKEKEYRSRFLSYDDEQNESLRAGLGDAEAVGKMQSPLEEDEYMRLFRNIAGRLTKREQVLFKLHYLERMTPVEIARKLGEKTDLTSYDIKALKSKVKGRVLSYARSRACGKR